MGWNARARAIIDFEWNNAARSHLVGNSQRITHAEQPTETRRAGNTGGPRSGRVAARGGGCATGACRHRANHRGPRFHAGKSKGRPHLKRCILQRERLLLRATWAFFMRSGKLYFLSSSTGTVPTSRPPSSTTATFRSAPVGASRDQPCDGLRVGHGLLVITAIETGGIDKPVAVLHVEKIPRHIPDRLLFSAEGAAPALCCGAGVGPRRPRDPEVVVAQSPKLRSSNSSDAPGIGQRRERDGMRSQRPQGAFRRRPAVPGRSTASRRRGFPVCDV